MEMARTHRIKVRGYLSMCFGCPFEGEISEGRVVRLVKRMVNMGVYEVSIGDTIGVANPLQVKRLVSKLVDAVGANHLAMHFHDTRGTALANVVPSLELGIRTFDSSLGGLGGCPYAPAATGNLATEDAVFMLHSMGYDTGIDLGKLIAVNHWMTQKIEHELPSRVGRAGVPRLLQ
jgi:hydroxymethylglutaryl-CoA lyase